MFNGTKAQPPRNQTIGNGDLYHSRRSSRQEASSRKLRREVSFVPPTPLRALGLAHEASVAVLPVLGEILGCPVHFIVTAPTEEGYPQMLPRMAISCG